MITHVKRNSQRAGFTKPSHIECDVGSAPIAKGCFVSRAFASSKPTLPKYNLCDYLSQRESDFRLYLFGGL